MPAYSKALSEELNKLFDTVEKQTLDYAQVFSYLSGRIEEFDNKIKELDNYREYFSNNFTNLAAETKVNINNTVEDLREKLDKVLQLHEQYSQIADYKDSLIIMHNQLKMIMEQNVINYKEFMNKCDYEFRNLMHNSRNKLDKELELVYFKSEKKLDTKLKFLEAQLIKLENKLLAHDERTNREINYTKSDINSLRNLINTVKNVSSGTLSDSEVINLKFEEVDKKLEEMQEEAIALKDKTNSIEKSKDEITTLRNKVNNIIKNQEETRKKSNAGSVISITAIILAIAAIVLAFVK